jgi:hypothetical protein
MTITPDHIDRPRETMRRFDRLAKKQQTIMKLCLQDMQTVLKKIGEEGEKEQGEDGKNNNQNMLTFLSNLSPGEKRLIRNRTSCAIQCRIYPATDCDTLKRPVMSFVLVPGGSVEVPTTTLATGVLLMQPRRNVPAEATDPPVWSKPQDLRLDALIGEGESVERFLATVQMEVQISMQADKVEAIMTDKGRESFKVKFVSAVSAAKNAERVEHKYLKRNGANLLRVAFSVTVSSKSEMGGLLFDCCAGLTHERLAAALKSKDLIAFEHDLCIVKEPTFVRIVDCLWQSLVVSSDSRMVLITAPWKLFNLLPKQATFKVFASADPAETPKSTEVLEAGQKLVCYSHAEAGVFIEVEMDGYTSPRRKILRKELKEECDKECLLKHTNGDRLCCMVDLAFVGNAAEFVVTFYMRMVVINRTGLNLSFGCCRLAGPQDGKKGARKREEMVPRILAEPNMLNKEKVML